jgi:hypothetical protein
MMNQLRVSLRYVCITVLSGSATRNNFKIIFASVFEQVPLRYRMLNDLVFKRK